MLPDVQIRIRRLALLAILALGFALRFHALDQNGWGAEYYTAAVRSMAGDAHRFLFAAFDPAGFLAVDKPPLALWIQTVSVTLFGFRPFSLLMPQVLAGVLSVAVLYRMTRPRLGAACALTAALLFAVTPVWVAVNRSNVMDTWLVLLLLLAAWALLRAVETARRGPLLLAAALTGLAFNVKMLAAFLVLPAFALVVLASTAVPLRRRLTDLAAAAGMLAVVCLPWLVLVETTAPTERPYVGSTSDNSILELIAGHNGAGRFVARTTATAPRPVGAETTPLPAPTPSTSPDRARGGSEADPFRTLNRLFVRTPTGPLRLADGLLAAQAAWWLPFALLALPALLPRRPNARTAQGPASVHGPGPVRIPPDARHVLVLWTAWLVTCALVYSAAGGIMHFYYLSMLAPPLSVLSACTLVHLWTRAAHDTARAARAWLGGAVIATAVWQFHIQSSALGWTPAWTLQHLGDWRGGMHAVLAAGAIAAVASVAVGRRAGTGLRAAGLGALVVVPLAWTFSSVLAPAHGMVPSADLQRLDPDQSLIDLRIRAGFGRTADHDRLIDFLQRHRGHERFLLSTTTTQLAAPLIIATGEPVMARGGYHGLDRAATPETLARAVAAGTLRFAMIGDASTISRRMGADRAQRANDAWIRANGRPVDPALWRTPGSRSRGELFDLRPDNGVASGSGTSTGTARGTGDGSASGAGANLL